MNRIILGLIIFLLFGCSHTNKDFVTVSFKRVEKCDKDGMPSDSSVNYFPSELFHDTVPGFFDGQSITRLYHLSKKEYADITGKKIESLKDTFEIVTDSSRIKAISYMLNKMREPILYSHYLGKDIYRIISMRSLSSPAFIVTIENFKDSVIVTSKRLNRDITYPFEVISAENRVIFTAPDVAFYDTTTNSLKVINKTKYIEQLQENKRTIDSLSKIYNNVDYHLVINQREIISTSAWDSLEAMIDTARFWKTNPELALGYMQIDGSEWIFEGHSKNGYQIRIVPSPHFTKRDFENKFDPKDNYAMIFKYLVNISGFKKEYLY